MSRWDPGDKRILLQQIADDERRPAHEREAVRRELTPSTQTAPSHRLGRNANVPMSHGDVETNEHGDLQRLLLVASNLFPGDVGVNRAGEQRGRHCDAIHGRKKSDQATIYPGLLTSNNKKSAHDLPIKDALQAALPRTARR
jgi:hypothetical protein